MQKHPLHFFSIRGRRVQWWHFAILGIVAAATVAGVAYHNVTLRIANSQAYVSDWDQLKAATNSQNTGSAADSAVSGVATNVAGRNYPIIKKDPIDPDIENYLLIGIDKGKKNETSDHRSDSMIVVSYNSKTHKVKLTSIMRDIRAYFPAQGYWDKINAAYSLGGPGYTVNIINYNFKLDIQKYVVVDFSGFRKIVDAAGGIDIELSAKELTQIPGLQGKKAGTYHLNGKQALAYSRIRHIDSDFYRVRRQKNALLKLYKKYRKMNLFERTRLANACLDYVKTNITTTEVLGRMFSDSTKVKGKITQFVAPSAGLYTSVSRPVFYFRLNWYGQVNAIYQFIFGKNAPHFTAPTDASAVSHQASAASSVVSSAAGAVSSSVSSSKSSPSSTASHASRASSGRAPASSSVASSSQAAGVPSSAAAASSAPAASVADAAAVSSAG